MPLVLLERLRNCPLCCVPSTRRDRRCAITLELFDILGGIVFIVGSVCFFPRYQQHALVPGCALFIVGSAIYVAVTGFILFEMLYEQKKGQAGKSEVFEAGLYFAGSILFLVGSVLYWPQEAEVRSWSDAVADVVLVDYDHDNRGPSKVLSLAAYLIHFEPHYQATLLFVVGSLFFVLAALTNLLRLWQKQDRSSYDAPWWIDVPVITWHYMFGAQFFFGGSITFLPELGYGDHMISLGAFCFVVGSILYVQGSCLSLARTLRFQFVSRTDEHVPIKQENRKGG